MARGEPAVELPRARSRRWQAVQLTGLAAFALLILGLVARPELALRALWHGLVPLLPALLLIHPSLWRNACPVATLGAAGSGAGAWMRLAAPASDRWRAAGAHGSVVLLALLVPARPLAFDADPAAVALAVGGAVLIAVGLGVRFPWKAGFCNAFCPMLPIERLYGQAPLIAVPNGRCGRCTRCSAHGCLDLAGARSIPQVLGRSRRSAAWTRTPFGLFATAFPGLILGFFLAPAVRGGGTDAVAVAATYATVLLPACASAAGARWLVRRLRATSEVALRGLAALSAVLFYALAAPGAAGAWGLGTAGAWAIRLTGGALAVAWWWRATRGGSARPGRRRAPAPA